MFGTLSEDIVFIGDIHRRWQLVEEGLAQLSRKPRVAVLLGDMECHEPLDTLVQPLHDHGLEVFWICGNHDYDGGPDMWANLTAPSRNPRTSRGTLQGRVVEIDGLRIAGLGGTFRRRVWEPPEPARLHARSELAADMETLGPEWSAEQREAMRAALDAMAIWPEDWHALAESRADILVTHEAPSSHSAGSRALDELARRMGAKLVVHGHHHVGYHAEADDGLRALSVGAAWGVSLGGTPLWQGEAHRWLGRAPGGWRYVPR